MAALPELRPHAAARSGAGWEPMADPLHPMHRELLRRVSAGPAATAAVANGLSRPARFAMAFYLGLGSWAAIGLGVAMLT